ncbi:MAG: AAA family ATPase [Desulfobulbaceae bacterium]|nr:MAG: AAA family ATPase [Desulfobulbaceae bacterium]
MVNGKKIITPPGLAKLLDSYDIFCNVAGDSPILVTGPSGVGKSYFLYRYKTIYRERYGSKVPVLYLDCSHFVGADSSLARSELFGHTKGAFTGANTDKQGLIKKTNGGALILDEIGELPENVQAMLLTFVETGKFRAIGSDKEDEAKVHIIAATNREEKLREELLYRFSPFNVTPLHDRRMDVLYFFAEKFEDFFRQLRPYEILSLLGYNWPGNVREVDRVGKIMQWQRIMFEKKFPGKLTRGSLPMVDEKLTKLHPADMFSLWIDLNYVNKVPTDRLEEELKNYHCDINFQNDSTPFDLGETIFDHNGEMKEKFQAIINQIEKGFRMLSYLLGYRGHEDLILFKSRTIKAKGYVDDALNKDEILPLFYSKQDGEKLIHWFSEYQSSTEPIDNDHLGKMSYSDLKILYFEKLLTQSGGNVTRAAEKAGIPLNTFRSKIEKLAIDPKKFR